MGFDFGNDVGGLGDVWSMFVILLISMIWDGFWWWFPQVFRIGGGFVVAAMTRVHASTRMIAMTRVVTGGAGL